MVVDTKSTQSHAIVALRAIIAMVKIASSTLLCAGTNSVAGIMTECQEGEILEWCKSDIVYSISESDLISLSHGLFFDLVEIY